jgi:hypothetical protein
MSPRSGHVTGQERRTIGFLLAAYSVVVLLLLAGLLIVSGQRRGVQRQIREVQKRLADEETLAGTRPLPLQLLDERYRSGVLRVEWGRYSALLDAGVPVRPVAQTNNGPTALIDFKVAYFEARRRLNERAATNGVSMPSGLGMSENVGPDEETTTRLLQLAAIERLVTMALDAGIGGIREIRPLRAGVVPAGEGERMPLLQCPVLLSFQCSKEQLKKLSDSVAEARYFFALNRVKIEWVDVRKPDVFNVTVGYSALIRSVAETNHEEVVP